MLDTLIRDAWVHDGNGGPPRQLDVGISGQKIAYLGPALGANAAKKEVTAKGLWLSPGFIDSHASTGLGYLSPHAADHKLLQGVTTELIGNCGTSTAPVGQHLVPTMNRLSEEMGVPFSWLSLEEWFDQVTQYGLPIHVATLVGHSTLRAGVLKNWKEPAAEDLPQMCKELERAMEAGALGLSSGLIYPPGCYAETSELIELAKVVAQFGGFYASHIRNERAQLEDAVQEAMEIGRGGNIPVLVSHLKAADRPNWGKVPRVLQQIEAFREAHQLQIIVDVYPYTAVSTKLRAFLPKALLKDGIAAVPEKLGRAAEREHASQHLLDNQTDLDAMMVISRDIPETTGRTITEIAKQWQLSPAQTACELVRRNPETWIVYHCMDTADMDAAVLWPDAIICSDSWSYPVNAPIQIGDPHPRTFGAFSRFLSRYVFETGKLEYGDAICKITSKPADFLGFKQRGRIAEGHWADLVLLNPDQFEDLADYQNPRRSPKGIEAVWVNGASAVQEGQINNDKCGTILKRAT